MTKPVIVKKAVKGSPLTQAELDQNFQNLDDATISLVAGSGGTTVTSDLNGTITLVAGTGISLAGDNTAKTLTISATNSVLTVNPSTITLNTAGATTNFTGTYNINYADVTAASGNVFLKINYFPSSPTRFVFLVKTTGANKLYLQTNGTYTVNIPDNATPDGYAGTTVFEVLFIKEPIGGSTDTNWIVNRLY